MNDVPMPRPLLEVDQVSLRYGGVCALDGLEFSLSGQGIWGVMGANGAGKSSLFNVVSGLQRPSSGEVRVLGQRSSHLPAWRVARLGIARTFQNIRLLSHLSVQENLLYATAAAGEGLFAASLLGKASSKRFRQFMAARAATLLGGLQLWDARDRLATTLPYGLQRRLEIGRALMLRPKLVLLDEPVAGMNASEKKHLGQLLPRLLEQTSAVIIEHDLSFLMALCKEVLVLHQGRLLARGAPESVQQDPQVRAHYLGLSPV